MDQSAATLRVMASHADDFSETEPLIAAMAAELPKGDAVLDPRRMAQESGFPLANKMMVALTPQRTVVYKTGWGSKVGACLGTVALERITSIEITWNRKLAIVAFGLADAPPVVMRAVDPEGAEHLRNQFLRLRGRI